MVGRQGERVSLPGMSTLGLTVEMSPVTDRWDSQGGVKGHRGQVTVSQQKHNLLIFLKNTIRFIFVS